VGEIVRGVFIAAVGAIVGGLALTWLLLPAELEDGLQVEVNWLELVGEFFPRNARELENLVPELEANLDVAHLGDLLAGLAVSRPGTLYRVEISNNSDQAISNVEAIIKGSFFSVIEVRRGRLDAVTRATQSSGAVSIETLDPGDKIIVLSVSGNFLGYSDRLDSVLILADGKSVSIRSSRVDRYHQLGFVNFIADNAPMSEFVFLIVIGMALVLLLGAGFSAFLTVKGPESMAKWASDRDVVVYARMVDWVRANQPNRLRSEKNGEDGGSCRGDPTKKWSTPKDDTDGTAS